MPTKPLDLAIEVAKAFVRDMRLYFAEKGHKADEIAVRQLRALQGGTIQASCGSP